MFDGSFTEMNSIQILRSFNVEKDRLKFNPLVCIAGKSFFLARRPLTLTFIQIDYTLVAWMHLVDTWTDFIY